MNKTFNANSVGIITGIIIGALHLTWSIVVMIGLAQPFMDWIYELHFLNNPFQVQTFKLTNAFILVLVTSAIGYLLGWVSTVIWNKLIK